MQLKHWYYLFVSKMLAISTLQAFIGFRCCENIITCIMNISIISYFFLFRNYTAFSYKLYLKQNSTAFSQCIHWLLIFIYSGFITDLRVLIECSLTVSEKRWPSVLLWFALYKHLPSFMKLKYHFFI